MKAGVGWNVGLYSVGAGGNGGAEGPDHAVWLTSLVFFSSSIRSSVLFFSGQKLVVWSDSLPWKWQKNFFSPFEGPRPFPQP